VRTRYELVMQAA